MKNTKKDARYQMTNMRVGRVSADQVMHQYQLQDTGYTNNSKQGQYKKREKRTKKST